MLSILEEIWFYCKTYETAAAFKARAARTAMFQALDVLHIQVLILIKEDSVYKWFLGTEEFQLLTII